MVSFHHPVRYELGTRELLPEERVVVGLLPESAEARRVARHLGVSEQQPEVLIRHDHFLDGEYVPTFLPKLALSRPEFSRYSRNYGDAEGKRKWGEGLRGRTVYIVHNFNSELAPQASDTVAKDIAYTAKYNGAEAVVLLAYTLAHSAQERGVHQLDHPRMQTEDAKERFDGQAPSVQAHLQDYAMRGVDAIITMHNHCPADIERLCQEINEYLEPLRLKDPQPATMRHKLRFYNVDLAPMVGMYVADYAGQNLGFDLSDSGRNVLFISTDDGATAFTRQVRKESKLANSALAIMDKRRAPDGRNVKYLCLKDVEGLTEERGIDGMDVLVCDDSIRSGETMRINIEALCGNNSEKLQRDSRIKGKPKRIAVYATRTNLAGNSRQILSTPLINDIVVTNADPRVKANLGLLDHKTQILWTNFIMAEAAKAVERGDDPNTILTADYIRRRKLLRIDLPHGHQSDVSLGNSGVL